MVAPSEPATAPLTKRAIDAAAPRRRVKRFRRACRAERRQNIPVVAPFSTSSRRPPARDGEDVAHRALSITKHGPDRCFALLAHLGDLVGNGLQILLGGLDQGRHVESEPPLTIKCHRAQLHGHCTLRAVA
jgi:hypothetical protein